jgi:hypothetical protein
MEPAAMGSNFTGALVMVGFGSIGQAMLPILLRDLRMRPGDITIVKARPDSSGIARALGVKVVAEPLDESNFETVLAPLLGAGNFLLNVSIDVSSVARCTWTPATSPGEGATTTPCSGPRCGRTTCCGRKCSRSAGTTRADPRRSSRKAPTRGWCPR